MKRTLSIALAACLAIGAVAGAQERVIRVELNYAAPGADKTRPAPNFSPKGEIVQLADLAAGAALPAGAVRPARAGVIKVGPGEASWVKVLATSDADHPNDLCRLYVDLNRNGNFADDGEPAVATPTLREKTNAVWCSFSPSELTIPYGSGDGARENYQVTAWIVRDGDKVPDVMRFSVRSWRAGSATIDGVNALVAAFDMDNNAIFDTADEWSVIEASAPDAAKQVLSHVEARPTNRLMFVKAAGREIVLQFRSMSPDGRTMEFAVLNRPVTKAEDRAPDDALGVERARPRATTPVAWAPTLQAALARAKSTGRKVLIDFWTDWCGPCKQLDQWIWTDAEVAAALNAGYVGVKLDGDVEKALVAKYKVAGYPTVIIADASGNVIKTGGYMSSKEALAFLR